LGPYLIFNLDLNHGLVLDTGTDLDFICDLVFDLELELDFAFDTEINLELDRDLDLTLTLTSISTRIP